MVSKGRLHGDFISLAQEIKMNALTVLLSSFLFLLSGVWIEACRSEQPYLFGCSFLAECVWRCGQLGLPGHPLV